MNHFFILGNHQELSAAELSACFNFKKTKFLNEAFLADLDDFDAKLMIKKLGGTIKIGRLLGRFSKQEVLKKMSEELLKAPKTSKFNFGISLYGKSALNFHKIGIDLKKQMKELGVSCRFVTSKEKVLSSVVVEQNKLVSSGRELVIISENNFLWLGVTEVVQPFKELSARDYGRPGRDDYSGMLPPKLAQIMINLARANKNEIILDPFCGSGTILTESLLMGYKKLAGSDISKKALDDSKKNIEWISKRYDLKYELRLSLTDARFLTKDFKDNSIGAIVAETYLGPQRGQVDYKKTSLELSKLYSDVLIECAKVLKKGCRVVLALPIFMNRLKLNLETPSSLEKINSYVYGRENQRVWREITIFVKK